MYEEIVSDICKGNYWYHIEEINTRLEKGDDFDEVIDKTIDNIFNEYLDYLKESYYKRIRSKITKVIIDIYTAGKN